MQEDHGLAVGLCRTDIHVRHGQRLALGLELVTLNRVRIVEVGEKRIGPRRVQGRQGECQADQKPGVDTVRLS